MIKLEMLVPYCIDTDWFFQTKREAEQFLKHIQFTQISSSTMENIWVGPPEKMGDKIWYPVIQINEMENDEIS